MPTICGLPHTARAVMVRSPHAHAAILGMDFADALEFPGVLAVLSGGDALAGGLQAIPHATGSSKIGSDMPLVHRDGSERLVTRQPRRADRCAHTCRRRAWRNAADCRDVKGAQLMPSVYRIPVAAITPRAPKRRLRSIQAATARSQGQRSSSVSVHSAKVAELRAIWIVADERLGSTAIGKNSSLFGCFSFALHPVRDRFHSPVVRIRGARLCAARSSRPSFAVSLRSWRALSSLAQLDLFHNLA
jgi:hypothetical protein